MPCTSEMNTIMQQEPEKNWNCGITKKKDPKKGKKLNAEPIQLIGIGTNRWYTSSWKAWKPAYGMRKSKFIN